MDSPDTDNEVAHELIGAAIEAHRHLGPGLFEMAYEKALVQECRSRGMRVMTQLSLPVIYKGLEVADAYRLDMLVNDRVIVEVKAIDRLSAIHESQLMTYLRFAGKRLGLLINFNRPMLAQGIRRVVLIRPLQEDSLPLS